MTIAEAPASVPTADLRTLDTDTDDVWDALVGNEPTSGFMQSSAWTDFKRSEGYSIRRYGYFERDTLRGGATIHYFPAPNGQGGMAVCPEGPVAPWTTDPPTARLLLRALQAAVQREFPDALGLRIEPHLPPPRPSLLRNYQRAPVDLTPTQTLILDLTRSDDALLADMTAKGRYNYRLSRKHGVSVAMSESASDVAAFYAMLADTAKRQQFYAEPYGFFLNLAAALFPGRHALLLFAEWQGERLATALIVFFGRRATYVYGGSSPRRRNVMPAYALHWAAIEEARRRGCVEYDFYGYDAFGSPDHPYAGFSAFKRQFGGAVYTTIGAQDYLFFDRLADRLIPVLQATHNERNGRQQ